MRDPYNFYLEYQQSHHLWTIYNEFNLSNYNIYSSNGTYTNYIFTTFSQNNEIDNDYAQV